MASCGDCLSSSVRFELACPTDRLKGDTMINQKPFPSTSHHAIRLADLPIRAGAIYSTAPVGAVYPQDAQRA